MYGLPHNDDLDFLQSHYLTTILAPVNAPGAYQLRVTAQDQAGNKQTVVHEVNMSP
jgi:hypothetical protein